MSAYSAYSRLVSAFEYGEYGPVLGPLLGTGFFVFFENGIVLGGRHYREKTRVFGRNRTARETFQKRDSRNADTRRWEPVLSGFARVCVFWSDLAAHTQSAGSRGFEPQAGRCRGAEVSRASRAP